MHSAITNRGGCPDLYQGQHKQQKVNGNKHIVSEAISELTRVLGIEHETMQLIATTIN